MSLRAPGALALGIIAVALGSCGGGDDDNKDLDAIEACLKDAGLAPTSIAPKQEAEAEGEGGEGGAAIEGALVVSFADQSAAHVDVYQDAGAAGEAFDAQQPLLERQGQDVERSGNVVLSSTGNAPAARLDQVRACAL